MDKVKLKVSSMKNNSRALFALICGLATVVLFYTDHVANSAEYARRREHEYEYEYEYR